MGAAAAFSVTTADRADGVTVVATGEIDLLAAPHLRTALLDATQSGSAEVAVDLSDTSFIDSTGLSVIVQAWRRAEADGHRLVVVAASPPVTRVLTTSGLAELLGLDS